MTEQPQLWRRTTSPRFSSSCSASRMGIELTPNRWISSRSTRRWPGRRCPPMMSRWTSSTISSRRDFGWRARGGEAMAELTDFNIRNPRYGGNLGLTEEALYIISSLKKGTPRYALLSSRPFAAHAAVVLHLSLIWPGTHWRNRRYRNRLQRQRRSGRRGNGRRPCHRNQ